MKQNQFKTSQILLEPWGQDENFSYTAKQRNQSLLRQSRTAAKSAPRKTSNKQKFNSFIGPMNGFINYGQKDERSRQYHQEPNYQQRRQSFRIPQPPTQFNIIERTMSPLVIKPNAQEFVSMKVPINTTFIGYYDNIKRKVVSRQSQRKSKTPAQRRSKKEEQRPATSMSFFNKKSDKSIIHQRNKSVIDHKSNFSDKINPQKSPTHTNNLQKILKLKENLRLKNKIKSERRDLQRKENLKESNTQNSYQYLIKQTETIGSQLMNLQTIQQTDGIVTYKHKRCHERVRGYPGKRDRYIGRKDKRLSSISVFAY